MIRIEITRKTREVLNIKKNQLMKKTPTGVKAKVGYNEREEVIYAEEYAPMEVQEVNERDQILLKQEIAEENGFDLAAVISAINKLSNR